MIIQSYLRIFGTENWSFGLPFIHPLFLLSDPIPLLWGGPKH